MPITLTLSPHFQTMNGYLLASQIYPSTSMLGLMLLIVLTLPSITPYITINAWPDVSRACMPLLSQNRFLITHCCSVF
jgi:hypothetical protein